MLEWMLTYTHKQTDWWKVGLHSCIMPKQAWQKWPFEPAHDIMVLFVPPKTHSSNTHAQPSSGARCLDFWSEPSSTSDLYFMCVNSVGSSKTGGMSRLAWAFAGRLHDKYHNLMSWLILYLRWKISTGPSCSKLTTSLVNVALKFQTYYT